MKQLLSILFLLLSLGAMSQVQVYNVPVTAGDSVFIKNGSKLLFSIPATGLDSAFGFTLQKFQKVPPPPPADSIRIVSTSSKTGTSMLTHTVTVPQGGFIVLLAGFSGSRNNLTIGGSTTLSWIKTADAEAANSGDAEIYTSSAPAGVYTITTSFGSGTQWSEIVVTTGCEGIGAKSTATAQGAPSVTLTTTKTNSLLIAVSADYNGRDGLAKVYRDNAKELFYNRAPDKSGTAYFYMKSAPSIKSYTEGISSPSTMAAGTAMVELRAKSGSVTVDTEPPSSPSLGTRNETLSSIVLSWTTSVDNTSVTGYDVYVDGKVVATTTQISYSVTGLSASTQYSFYVAARDAAGNFAKSNVVTASTLSPPNQAPVASAGADVTLVLPANSTTLSGAGSKDPDGSIIFYKWSYLSGPSQWSIGDPAASTTTLANLAQGSYVFRLQVTDNQGAIAVDDIAITVNAAAPIDTTTVQKAEGFGSAAIGGASSSDVRHVKTASEFANAIGSNRTILFDVDIIITGSAARVGIFNTTFLTISSNGHDVTIDNGNNGDGVSIGSGSHHIIIDRLRVINAGGDGINVVDGAHDVLITNCISYGNRDGNIDVAADKVNVTKNVTVQWCIFGPGASNNGSYSGEHLITGQSVSSHHNLFLPSTPGGVGERNPLVHCNYSPVGSPNADFRNNVVSKWGRSNGTGSGYGSDVAYSATANIVNNFYYSVAAPGDAVVTNGSYGSTPAGSAYVSGNVSGNSTVNPNSANNHAEYIVPDFAKITMQPACDAAQLVLKYAGNGRLNQTEIDWIKGVLLPGCQSSQ